MSKKTHTKRALLSSVIALILCCAMLLGTTFAWFTDTTSTSVNTINSGNLEIALEYSEDGGTTWTDAEGKTLNFKDLDSHTYWEPGCTYELPLIRVRNGGNLALKYTLSINGVTDNDKLLEAIDFTANGAAITSFTGHLDKGTDSSETILIKGHMKEQAGNEYQNLSISGIGISVTATQHTYESDSYGNQYDAGANAIEVDTAEALQNVLNAGGYAKLTADISSPNNQRFNVPEGVAAGIDLNGHTLTSKDGGGSNTMAIYVNRGAKLTLDDFSDEGTGKLVSSCYGVYVQPNASFTMNGGTISVSGNSVYDIGVTVWNGEFTMNGGTISAKYGVWTSNYWKSNGQTDVSTCKVTISENCTVTSSSNVDIDITDALDTILNVPTKLEVNKTAQQ